MIMDVDQLSRHLSISLARSTKGEREENTLRQNGSTVVSTKRHRKMDRRTKSDT